MRAFLRVLERELPQLGCELRVITPPQRVQRLPRTSRLWKWLGYIDKFIFFIPSLAMQARWADVVHICDHSNSMYVRWVNSRPTIVTCHDVIAVQAARGMVEGWNVGWSGRIFQRLIASGLAKADLVACVSHTTARALVDLQLVDERRVTTVLNGLNDSFSLVQPAGSPAADQAIRSGRTRQVPHPRRLGFASQESQGGHRNVHRASTARCREWCPRSRATLDSGRASVWIRI